MMHCWHSDFLSQRKDYYWNKVIQQVQCTGISLHTTVTLHTHRETPSILLWPLPNFFSVINILISNCLIFFKEDRTKGWSRRQCAILQIPKKVMTHYLARKLALLDVDFPLWSYCHSQALSLYYQFTPYTECIGAKLNFLEFAEDQVCLFCVSRGTEHSHISATPRSHHLLFCATIPQCELYKTDLPKFNSFINPLPKKKLQCR